MGLLYKVLKIDIFESCSWLGPLGVLVRATVEHELIVSYLEFKNAIFLVLTLIKHSLGMSEQLSL